MASEDDKYVSLKRLKAKQREMLKEALDDELSRANRLFVQKSNMGGNESYIASVPLSWLSEHVQFAQNLPLFKEKLDPSGMNIVVDDETIDMLKQRPINYGRQYPMAQYLLNRRYHKFPPILTVLNTPWVDDPHSDQWVTGGDGTLRAIGSCAEFESLTTEQALGMLVIREDMQLYALDGQHRLLAVQGMMNFIKEGHLEEKKSDGKFTGTRLSRQMIDLTDSQLQALLREKIGVEILPAVMQGESRDESRQRIRRIFVHVNRMAVSLDIGMMTALDEDNGFRILGKNMVKNHKLFNRSGEGGEKENLVEIKKPSLLAASAKLTTLETVANSARLYLEHESNPFADWLPKNLALVPRRPDQEELLKGIETFSEFLDRFSELPIMQRIAQGESCKKLREFKETDSPHHFLLRPIAQQIVAEAVGYCHFEKGADLDVLFRKLKKLDRENKFDNIDKVQSYWWGLQVKPGDPSTMKKQQRPSATKLMIYLLGGYHGEREKVEELKELAINDRKMPPPDETLYGFDGEVVQETAFTLPPPIMV